MISDTVRNTYSRMSQAVYENFEKQFMKPSCPKTDIEAAYNLGVQAVLAALRKDIVISIEVTHAAGN